MKSKTITGIGAGLFLIVNANAGVMQNEPKEFRGIEWGAPIDSLKSELTLLAGDDETAHYRRPSDTLTFANIDVRRISYRFYKNRFSAGTILTVGSSNLKAVLGYLSATYGPPETISERHRVYNWNGDHAGITVACDMSISCYVEFYGKEMRSLEGAAQEAPSSTAGDDDK